MSKIEPTPAETGTQYDVLANRWRRHLIWCLSEHDQPVALADVARDVTAREQDQLRTEIPAEAIKRVETMLYHSHIPRLCDADLVEYDSERRTVTSTRELDDLKKTMEAVDRYQPRRPR